MPTASPAQPATQTSILKPSRGWRAVDVRELWRFRNLVRAFASRDVKLRYRQTALGVVWVVLQPLIAAAIFAFVFGRVADLPSGGVPYVVFAFAGLLGWNLFSLTVTKSSLSLLQHSGMVQKVYFPRLALPLSVVPGALLDFAVGLGLMAVLLIATGTAPSIAILTLPVWVALMLMLALGFGLVAGALTVSYRDVQQVLPVLVQMLLYISPVAYSLEAIPDNLRFVYSLNPLVGVLQGFRWALLAGELSAASAAYSAAMALLAIVAGVLVFRRMERRFADVV